MQVEHQNIRQVQKQIQRKKKDEIIEIRKNIKKLIHKKRRNSNYLTYYLEPSLFQIKKNLKQRQITLIQIKEQNRNEGIQEFQTNLNQITQQLQQLDDDLEKKKQQMIKEYKIERQTQELEQLKNLLQSNLEDLKKIMLKEDFDQPQYGQSQNIPNTAQYGSRESIEQMEQIISNHSKRINTFLIRIHLFINNRIIREKHNEQNLKQLESEYQKYQQLLKVSSTKCDENHQEFNKIQKVITKFEQQKSGTNQLQQNLQTYFFLKNIYQESKNSCYWLDSLKNEYQELNQKVLGIGTQLMEVYKYNIAEINQNIHQKDNDFKNEANQLKNKVYELDQALKDRMKLKIKLEEAQVLYEQQQAQNSRYEVQVIQLQNVLEQQIPQVVSWSEKDVSKEYERINEKLVVYEQVIVKNNQSLEDIKKSGGLLKQQREEIKRHLADIKERLTNVKKAKTTIGFQLTDISIKLNQLKEKNIDNREELQKDLNNIGAQIKLFITDGDEIAIQRGFAEFVQQLNENGSKRSNNALLQSYLLKYDEHINDIEDKRKNLQEKKNQLQQQLQSGSIPQLAINQQQLEQSQRQTEEIKKCKRLKQKLMKRLGKTCQIRQQQIEEMIKLNDKL